MGKTIITAKVLGMAPLPVPVLWREISTIPNGENLGQMKKFVLLEKQFRNSAHINSACSV